MNIATETQRLIQAKADLKASIEKRGANISTESRIDTFASILDSCPYAVEGTFVPENDTKTFEISGLTFTPKSLFIVCSNECVSSGSGIPLSIIGVNGIKGLKGFVQHRDNSLTVNIAYLGESSSIFAWSEDGVKVTVPIERYFKSGLVYNYYILGGVEDEVL
jgi:hypothetical protein